jgi:regulator of sigma E protease
MGYLIIAASMVAFLLWKWNLGEWVTLGTVVLMILWHEAAHWVSARWFGFEAPEFKIGIGPTPKYRLFRLWGTDFFITPWLIGGSVDFDSNCDTCQTKPGWQRLLVGSSGLFANFALALVLMFGLFAVSGEQHVVPTGISVLSVVGKQSAAAAAGLKRGDRIVTVDGVAVKTYDELHAVLLAHKQNAPAAVVVNRLGQSLTFNLRPNSRGLIGVKLVYHVKVTYDKMGPWTAAVRAWQVVAGMGASFFAGVLMLFHLIPVPPGATPGSGAVHGLLSIVQLGGIAFQQGSYSFLRLLATVSVTLTFANLIPAPMFDGGHLVFYAWEKLTGKPVPRWLRKRLAKICLWIVVAFMLYATFNDILFPVA